MEKKYPQCLKKIAEYLLIPQDKTTKIIKDFHGEMSKGLSGRKSSLAMIPTFAFMPTGKEKGRFIALDLGGTNFRILEVLLSGNGRIHIKTENKFKLPPKVITGTGTQLFNFIADKIKCFLRASHLSLGTKENLGFTFSFPIKQSDIKSGKLLSWTKEFSASGVVGKDVVMLLKKALKRKGINNIKITALLNDTTGTLAARAYNDKNCNLSIILGTGTNACYPEKIFNIRKIRGLKTARGEMIINIEWGNFNKLPLTPYDRTIDKLSVNPGRQRLEKMVSGLYLGEAGRLIILDLKTRNMLFTNTAGNVFTKSGGFKTEYLSVCDTDNTRRLDKISGLLKRLGAASSTYEDRLLIKRICRAILVRSAHISSTAAAAIILWIDPKVNKKHHIAIDGSLFEKCPNYPRYMKDNLRQIFKNKSPKIKLALAKDGTGMGAAVVAATECRRRLL